MAKTAITTTDHELIRRLLPATALQRLGALAVDILLFCALVLAPAAMISYWLGPNAGFECDFSGSTETCQSSPEAVRFTRQVGYTMAAMWLVVYAWFIGRGASIGKRATEVMVIDATTGATIGFARAFARTVLAVLGLVCFGVGLWATLFDSRRRALHDRAMVTRVISP